MTESAQKASETRKQNEAKRREMFLRIETDKAAIRAGMIEIINGTEATVAAVNRITNMLLNGEIDPKTANAILYGCNVCLGAIRVDDQQAKLDELEKIVEELGDRHGR